MYQKVSKYQLLAETAEKNGLCEQRIHQQEILITEHELLATNRERQEPHRGATISTLPCPSNEGTECYVNLKVQCRFFP